MNSRRRARIKAEVIIELALEERDEVNRYSVMESLDAAGFRDFQFSTIEKIIAAAVKKLDGVVLDGEWIKRG